MKNKGKQIENKNKNEYKTRWFKEDLPSLIESDKECSLSHENKLWALGFANPEDIGMSYWSKELGIMLQNVGDYRVRCILAIDSSDARIGLAMFYHTFTAIGVKFEVGEYTVVVPVGKQENTPHEVDEASPVPGMEVV